MPYPYEVLEIPEDSGDREIRKAYLEKIRQYPPEADPLRFSKIAEAYELIKDEVSRARLELWGVPGTKIETPLSDMVMKDENTRNKPGIDPWLKLLQKDTDD